MSTPGLMWQRGRVVAVHDGRVRVRLKPVSTCRDCLQGKGCGAGVFSRLFARRTIELELHAREAHQPGDVVMLGVAPAALTRAALLLYGAPVMAFVAAILVATGLLGATGVAAWLQDVAALAAGIAAAGLLLVWHARRPLGGLAPVVTAAACAGRD